MVILDGESILVLHGRACLQVISWETSQRFSITRSQIGVCKAAYNPPDLYHILGTVSVPALRLGLHPNLGSAQGGPGRPDTGGPLRPVAKGAPDAVDMLHSHESHRSCGCDVTQIGIGKREK